MVTFIVKISEEKLEKLRSKMYNPEEFKNRLQSQLPKGIEIKNVQRNLN